MDEEGEGSARYLTVRKRGPRYLTCLLADTGRLDERGVTSRAMAGKNIIQLLRKILSSSSLNEGR